MGKRDGAYVCPKYSTDIAFMAKQLDRLAESAGPGAGWHLDGRG